MALVCKYCYCLFLYDYYLLISQLNYHIVTNCLSKYIIINVYTKMKNKTSLNIITHFFKDPYDPSSFLQPRDENQGLRYVHHSSGCCGELLGRSISSSRHFLPELMMMNIQIVHGKNVSYLVSHIKITYS